MKRLKRLAHHIPFAQWLYGKCTAILFPGSRRYWEGRYGRGGNSGDGSYGEFAEFKAEVVNSFVRDNRVKSVIEYGCGDGNQLSIAQYPSYIGLDVSKTAIQICKDRFKDDPTKSFFLYDPDVSGDQAGELVADLALSLDVIYHLVEDTVYDLYMTHLFNAARRFVVVYSSNQDSGKTAAHVRHRCFCDWVSERATGWTLRQKIDNKFPFDPKQPEGTYLADFYVFEKAGACGDDV